MTDICLKGGEIDISTGDFLLVDGKECILQDIRQLLYTECGSLFYDETYGSEVLYFIHQNVNDTSLLTLKQSIGISIKSDNRVERDSVEIVINQVKDGVEIKISLLTVYGDSIEIKESMPMRS